MSDPSAAPAPTDTPAPVDPTAAPVVDPAPVDAVPAPAEVAPAAPADPAPVPQVVGLAPADGYTIDEIAEATAPGDPNDPGIVLDVDDDADVLARIEGKLDELLARTAP